MQGDHQAAGAEIRPRRIYQKHYKENTHDKSLSCDLHALREGGYMVTVPDFPLNTQGDDMAEAIFMARDAIGLMGITMQDDGQPLPEPSALQSMDCAPGEIASLVDIDFDAYRRAHEHRTVRRNVTLPAWLDEKARQSDLNVSAVLQAALKHELKVE